MKKMTPKVAAELKRVAAMRDEDIDTSDIPEVLDWTGAIRGALYRPIKRAVTIRLDADVLEWFRAQGAGYQTRLNQALREYVTQHRSKVSSKPAVHERRASYAVGKRK
jgi:uncharacterized protein (DUF4415 family)